MMRVIFSALIVLGSTLPAASLSLNEAVRLAVDSGPEVLEARANQRAISEELNQARALYFPTIDLEGFVGPQFVDRPESLDEEDNAQTRAGAQASVVASWTVFDGFFRANERFRQATRIEGAGFRILEAAELVALDAVEAYVDVIRHRRVLEAADENVTQHRFILGQAREQFDGGAATRGEVELAEERLAVAEAVRADVLRALGEVSANFIRVVGQEPRRLNSPSFPSGLPQSVDSAISIARVSNPTLTAAALEVQELDAASEQEGSEFFPTLSVEARGSTGFDINGTPDEDIDASLRLVMRWRLFDGGLRQAQKRESVERVGEAQARQDRFRRDVDEGVRIAWNSLTTNDIRLSALRRQLSQAELVLSAYYEELDAGLRSLIDILNAQSSRFNAQFEVASSEAIAVFARYQLIASTGLLLDQFGLENVAPELELTADDLTLHRTGNGISFLEPLRR